MRGLLVRIKIFSRLPKLIGNFLTTESGDKLITEDGKKLTWL